MTAINQAAVLNVRLCNGSDKCVVFLDNFGASPLSTISRLISFLL